MMCMLGIGAKSSFNDFEGWLNVDWSLVTQKNCHETYQDWRAAVESCINRGGKKSISTGEVKPHQLSI